MERDQHRVSRAIAIEEEFRRCLFCIPGRIVTIVEFDPISHKYIVKPERYNFVDELTEGLVNEEITHEITPNSPLGEVLLGAKKGTTINYSINSQEIYYKILKIKMIQ